MKRIVEGKRIEYEQIKTEEGVEKEMRYKPKKEMRNKPKKEMKL
ncbi:hypothetical protein RSJ42_13900 [Methanosarcina hadiensis]